MRTKTREKKMIQPESEKINLLFSPPTFTKTKSSEEFASLREQISQEIQPKGFIERLYVDDAAALVWDILSLRCYKAGILKAAFLLALQGIVYQLLSRQDYDGFDEHEIAAEKLARGWFENEKAKTQVIKLLERFGLDESAVEAEAFRSRLKELEQVDRLLTFAEARRDKALRSIAEYRQSLAKQIEQNTDQILENDGIPELIAIERLG
jgi:hypothetical protein